MQTRTLLKQRGMSLGGLIFFLIFLVFAVYVAARTVPAYMDYWQLGHVMENSLQTLGGEELTPKEIRRRFERELSLNNIDTVGPQDLTIEPTKTGFHLSAEYTVKKPLWRQISLCFDFKVERESK
ncbi:MAG: DUF4845 domain-containing protein [Pseudomonadota bacterium]